MCLCLCLGSAVWELQACPLALSPVNGFLSNVQHIPPTPPQLSASAGLQLVQAQSKSSQYIHVETPLRCLKCKGPDLMRKVRLEGQTGHSV